MPGPGQGLIGDNCPTEPANRFTVSHFGTQVVRTGRNGQPRWPRNRIQSLNFYVLQRSLNIAGDGEASNTLTMQKRKAEFVLPVSRFHSGS